MRYYEKLYVGRKKGDEGDIIGFATHLTSGKDFEKRRTTVENWVGKGDKPLSPITVDNIPVSGFKVVGFASRWSTSNKLVQIADPRGFILEISVENLVNLLEKTTIRNGVFECDLVWLRDTDNVLSTVDHMAYSDREAIAAAKDVHNTTIGNVYQSTDRYKTKWMYLGRHRTTLYNILLEKIVPHAHNKSLYFSGNKVYTPNGYGTTTESTSDVGVIVNITQNEKTKLKHIYTDGRELRIVTSPLKGMSETDDVIVMRNIEQDILKSSRTILSSGDTNLFHHSRHGVLLIGDVDVDIEKELMTNLYINKVSRGGGITIDKFAHVEYNIIKL